jgi:hypothetical protein
MCFFCDEGTTTKDDDDDDDHDDHGGDKKIKIIIIKCSERSNNKIQWVLPIFR